MGSKKRVKELYYHETSEGSYTVDMVVLGESFLKDEVTGLTEEETQKFLKDFREGKNPKFQPAKRSFNVYNRLPEQRMLNKKASYVFDKYANNLYSSNLKENFSCTTKVANLLRAVSDLIDEEESQDSLEILDPRELDSRELELSLDRITPDLAVDPSVPLRLISRISDALGVEIDSDNLTFMFQDQKWQLTKDGFQQTNTPKMKRPTTSHNVEGSLQYIMNLLGSNCEITYEEGVPTSCRFVDEGEVYRISHIYTGDHNTLNTSD